jgi:plastocyanin
MAGSIPAAVVTPAAYTCDVPPRSEPPAAIEGTPEPGPIVPTMRLENTQLLLDDADIPNVGTGEPIPDGALEGINATLRLFVECENAALNAPFDDDSVVLDIRAREFSFFTDDYLRRHKNPAPPETPEPRARALPWWAHEWQTAFWSPGLSMPALVQPVVLRDGGVGMKVVFDDSTMYYVVFAQVEGRWLIDEVAHTTTLLGEPASTPAPSFSIILSDILYLPNSLTITGNRPVNLTLANTGQARHSFNIDALSIHVELEPGEMTTVTVVGPAGTYEFYCDVPGHREAGMSGQLVIEEPFYSLDDVTVTLNPGGATPALCLACAATPPAERGS